MKESFILTDFNNNSNYGIKETIIQILNLFVLIKVVPRLDHWLRVVRVEEIEPGRREGSQTRRQLLALGRWSQGQEIQRWQDLQVNSLSPDRFIRASYHLWTFLRFCFCHHLFLWYYHYILVWRNETKQKFSILVGIYLYLYFWIGNK